MPRSFKLTWQPGANGREGRWRKKYKGKQHYFAGGRGKFDREAYDAAVSAWEALKPKLDAEAPRPFEEAHTDALTTWEQALAWSNRHHDGEMAELAQSKVDWLRQRLERPVLSPLARQDQFDAVFDLPTIPLPAAISNGTLVDFSSRLAQRPIQLDSKTRAAYSAELDGSPTRIAREVWHDRLRVQQAKSAPSDESLGARIDQFLKHKEQLTEAGELSVGRLNSLRLELTHFRDWLGKETNVKEIDGGTLIRFHTSLLDKVKGKKWTRTTANHYLTSIKSFVRWLWQTEAIAALPRLLDSRSGLLRIGRNSSTVVVFSVGEIKTLLAKASPRTQLYILLMLNCGMTQKDISDLCFEEVDWKAGRIIRKRSKTSSEDNVPVVNYLLWTETFRLLKREKNPHGKGRVLLNSQGAPLWTEELGAENKYKKTDNIKNAFDRLKDVTEIRKPLKSFKKTSASLLRANERFQGLEGLFLGHAPQSMSDKHYTQIPQQLLDEAVTWLRTAFGLSKSARKSR